MRIKKYILGLILFFCVIWGDGDGQSFVKTYTDLGANSFGLNILSVANKRTAVLGTGNTGAFTRLVDSTGKVIYTDKSYPEYQYWGYDNLTATDNGYVFYYHWGYNNMGNPNHQDLIFSGDTLKMDTLNEFYVAKYSSITGFNLHNVFDKGLFLTCTVWWRPIGFPYHWYTPTFISKYDTNGRRVWNNSFGPTDTDQIFNSIISSDSDIVVSGMISGQVMYKKYDLNGNLLLQHNYNALVYSPIVNATYNLFNIAEVKKNFLTLSDTIDASTHKYQLALEVTDLNGNSIGFKKFVLFNDTTDLLPISISKATDTTALLHYSVPNSTLNYYLIVDYKGDSIGSFVLPACNAVCYNGGNILCENDSTGAIIVREYNTNSNVTYKYVYTPDTALNFCNDIKALTSPGRFLLTGGSNNKLLIIRQDTNYIAANASASRNVTCFGGNDGSAIANASFGIQPYTYSWHPSGGTNARASGLTAGTYTVTITDNNHSSNNAILAITQPPALASKVTTTNSSCTNPTGTIFDSVYGGVQPYTYMWSNGRTNDTLHSLTNGSYTCTVTDAHGCIKIDSVYLDKGPRAILSFTNLLCLGVSTGVATVTVPGNFTYSWAPSGGTDSTATGLSAGTYTVTLTNMDTLGCDQYYTFTLTQPATSPAATFSVTTFGPCNSKNAITATVTGGLPPYKYLWEGGSTTSSAFFYPTCFPDNTADTLFVTDKNGCVTSLGITLKPTLNWVGTYQTNLNCNNGNDGTITVQVCGGTGPYTYNWFADSAASFNPSYTITNLSAGIYSVTVTDSNGCNIGYFTFSLTQPTPINISKDSTTDSGGCNGSAWVGVWGGTGPYTYLWTGGLTTDTIQNQCAGYYCCTVTDNKGCVNSTCVNIPSLTGTNELTNDNGELTVYPNPNNGVFTIVPGHGKLASGSLPIIEIFNVLGEKVTFGTLKQIQGDYEVNMSKQPNGVYFYRVLNTDGSLIGSGKIVIQK